MNSTSSRDIALLLRLCTPFHIRLTKCDAVNDNTHLRIGPSSSKLPAPSKSTPAKVNSVANNENKNQFTVIIGNHTKQNQIENRSDNVSNHVNKANNSVTKASNGIDKASNGANKRPAPGPASSKSKLPGKPTPAGPKKSVPRVDTIMKVKPNFKVRPRNATSTPLRTQQKVETSNVAHEPTSSITTSIASEIKDNGNSVSKTSRPPPKSRADLPEINAPRTQRPPRTLGRSLKRNSVKFNIINSQKHLETRFLKESQLVYMDEIKYRMKGNMKDKESILDPLLLCTPFHIDLRGSMLPNVPLPQITNEDELLALHATRTACRSD